MGYIILLITIVLIIKYLDSKDNKTTYRNKNTTIKSNEYLQSEYYKETKIQYEDMLADKGRAGEYATYNAIKNVLGYKKFVFNTYLTKSDNNTTEIDIIMIHEKGVFAIECKNYNGSIYGKEEERFWTVFYGRKGEKHQLYNPILQNSNHIRYLKKELGDNINIYSVIAFGNGANIKNIKKTSERIILVKNYEMEDVIKSNIFSISKTMTQEQVDEIYNKLKSISGENVSQEIKEQHISNINNANRQINMSNKEQSADKNKQEIMLTDLEKELIMEYRKLNEEDKKETLENIKKVANF